MPASVLARGETIHNILVIAEEESVGACLEAVLREHGYHVRLAESYNTVPDVFLATARSTCDLVIVTNTSLPPARIRAIVPSIKARNPRVRIVVLSGYYPDDFVTELKQKGIDGFLTLPFKKDVLLTEVARQMSGLPPLVEGFSLS